MRKRWFIENAYMERVDVRIKPDFAEELIKLNLKSVLDGSKVEDILLKGMDRVIVYGMSGDGYKKHMSQFQALLKNQGRYVLQENMTL